MGMFTNFEFIPRITLENKKELNTLVFLVL